MIQSSARSREEASDEKCGIDGHWGDIEFGGTLDEVAGGATFLEKERFVRFSNAVPYKAQSFSLRGEKLASRSAVRGSSVVRKSIPGIGIQTELTGIGIEK